MYQEIVRTSEINGIALLLIDLVLFFENHTLLPKVKSILPLASNYLILMYPQGFDNYGEIAQTYCDFRTSTTLLGNHLVLERKTQYCKLVFTNEQLRMILSSPVIHKFRQILNLY